MIFIFLYLEGKLASKIFRKIFKNVLNMQLISSFTWIGAQVWFFNNWWKIVIVLLFIKFVPCFKRVLPISV